MAFSEVVEPYARRNYCTYYHSQGSAAATASTIIVSLAMSHILELRKIRLHLTVAFPSVRDYMVYLDHHLSTGFDQNLISQAMNGIQDVMYQVDPTIILHSGDALHFSLMHSAAGFIGIEVAGWAVTMAPR